MRTATRNLASSRSNHLLKALIVIGLFVAQDYGTARAFSQARASSTIRSVVEGTWQLEEWHINGEVLKPPQVDGRWSNHDGVVLFVLHRSDGANATSSVGYGVYEMNDTTWSYRYSRMENSNGPVGGPAKVTISQPAPQMRSFKISRQGSKVLLEGEGGDRREYDGPYFTLFQNDKVVRKWRRIG